MNDLVNKPPDTQFPLRYDPLHIFRESRTPAGLYARQKWLGESGASTWQQDFQETVRSLMNGQSDDGSWHHSPLESIRRLFGLHLTVRTATGEIEKALRWLIERTLDRNTLHPPVSVEPISPDAFRELPFTAGNPHFALVCATLFLASIFQRNYEHAVLIHYQLLSRWVAEQTGSVHTWSGISNALRALIVHPDYGEGSATTSLVERLGEIQDTSGRWPAPIPFFQTVNALAHLRLTSAHRQWVIALKLLSATQNTDGSWGHENCEWNTFLVVHALKNKECL